MSQDEYRSRMNCKQSDNEMCILDCQTVWDKCRHIYKHNKGWMQLLLLYLWTDLYCICDVNKRLISLHEQEASTTKYLSFQIG